MDLEKRSSVLYRGLLITWVTAGLGVFLGCSDTSETPRLPDVGLDAGIHPDAASEPDAGEPDLGLAPDAGEPDAGIQDLCDPLLQSGCEAPAAKCIIERGGAECTVPGGEDRAVGETCGGGQCQGGLVCIGDGTGADPTCRQICDRETGAGCAELAFEADCLERVRNTNWGVCSPLPPACDVLTQEPCPAEESCQPFFRFDGTFDLRCRPAGPGLEGEQCSTQRCTRGHVCVNLGGVLECKKVCDDDLGCEPDGACNGRVNGVAVKYCTR